MYYIYTYIACICNAKCKQISSCVNFIKKQICNDHCNKAFPANLISEVYSPPTKNSLSSFIMKAIFSFFKSFLLISFSIFILLCNLTSIRIKSSLPTAAIIFENERITSCKVNTGGEQRREKFRIFC